MELRVNNRTIEWVASAGALDATTGGRTMKAPGKTDVKRFPPGPRDEDAALVALESQPFQDFEVWMDAELERLVARWVHAAAPNAARIGLLSGRHTS